jgi:hypothetical protein
VYEFAFHSDQSMSGSQSQIMATHLTPFRFGVTAATECEVASDASFSPRSSCSRLLDVSFAFRFATVVFGRVFCFRGDGVGELSALSFLYDSRIEPSNYLDADRSVEDGGSNCVVLQLKKSTSNLDILKFALLNDQT